MTDIEVHVPVLPRAEAAAVARAPRPAPADIAAITLVSNGKPRALDLLEHVAELLGPAVGDVSLRTVAKDSAAKPLTRQQLESVADGTDLVVLALGDCGACSACSVEDAAALERLGVASTVVVTEPFQGSSARVAVGAGVPDLSIAVVPHPVASRDLPTVHRYAQAVAEVLLADLDLHREQNS